MCSTSLLKEEEKKLDFLLLYSWIFRYSEDLELDDAVHTAILTLKEGFEGQMTAENIEIGIADESGFRRLDVATVQDHLSNIPQ